MDINEIKNAGTELINAGDYQAGFFCLVIWAEAVAKAQGVLELGDTIGRILNSDKLTEGERQFVRRPVLRLAGKRNGSCHLDEKPTRQEMIHGIQNANTLARLFNVQQWTVNFRALPWEHHRGDLKKYPAVRIVMLAAEFDGLCRRILGIDRKASFAQCIQECFRRRLFSASITSSDISDLIEIRNEAAHSFKGHETDLEFFIPLLDKLNDAITK